MLAEVSKPLDAEEKKRLSESVDEPEERKMTQAEMEEFLARNKSKKKQKFVKITDMAQWKKKNRIDENTKVFIVSGGYSTIKKELLARGWFRNQDTKSTCFDLKWILKAKDINHKKLEPHQIVNHFPKSTDITTKVGLCRSMKILVD